MTSRLCEEFPGSLPSQVEAEPLKQMLQIAEMRALARAKEQLDAATKDDEKPRGPMGRIVEQLKAEQLREAHDAG